MSNIMLLTRLQILQTIGGVRAAIEKRTGTNGAMAGTILISAMALGGIGWLGWWLYGVLGGAGLSKTVYDMLFLICGALTFAFSLPAVLSSFFGSSDIGDLLPLPVTPFAIVFSKALGALAASYLWTFLLLAAPLAGWGIAAGAGLHYWITYLLVVIFAPLMPTAYAGTLSILIASVFKRVRRKDAITTITTVVSLAVSLGIYFVTNNLHLNEQGAKALGGMADTMGSVVMAFPAYGFAVHALQQQDFLGTGMFVLISVAAFIVFVAVARFLYLRIVTSISTGGAKAAAYDGTAKQEQTPVLSALVRNEVHKLVRNSSVLLYYAIYPLVVTPVLLVVSMSTGSLDKLPNIAAQLGDVTTQAAGIGIAVAMVFSLLGTMSNQSAATCISREGSNWIYMKFVPVPLRTQMLAKTLTGFILSTIIVTVYMGGCGYLLVGKLGIDVLVFVCGYVLALGAAWLMLCVAARADSHSPNVEWGNDGDVSPKNVKGNAGTLRALLVGIIYAALPVLASPLVGLEPRVFMPVIAAVGVVAAVVLGRLCLNSAARNMQTFE